MHDFLDKLWSMEFGAALLGAVAGGLFSILGAWWQSSVSNKAAARAQAEANAQRGFDTLNRLRAHLEAQTFQGIGTGDSREAWNRDLRGMISEAEGPIMLQPDAHKETRSQVLTLLHMIKNWNGLPVWPEYQIEVRLLLSEAIKFLGLFVRGSKVPEKRDMTAGRSTSTNVRKLTRSWSSSPATQSKANWTERTRREPGRSGSTSAFPTLRRCRPRRPTPRQYARQRCACVL